MRILSADVGGTKALFRSTVIAADALVLEREEKFDSEDYLSVSAMLAEFEHDASAPAAAACMAVAGPVAGGRAVLTNLGWEIDEQSLALECGIPRVRVVNDFWAVARGVPLLSPEQLETISEGRPDRSQPIAILGAGTGLGEAILLPEHESWRIVPSEGGHCDFAPIGSEQRELHAFLEERFGHVSYERLVSGQGIANIYRFLRHSSGLAADVWESETEAAHVAALAADGDATANRALDMFVEIYAAEAGNLALKVLARGGVFLAGGIAPRHIARFTSGRFQQVFEAKGRFEPIMKGMPVHIIRDARVGLIGATAAAADLARRG